MNNKIGFNLLAWSAGVSEDLVPHAERLKKIGYDGIECALGERNKNKYKIFGDHLSNLGLEATCVLVVGADENPASNSSATREKGLNRIKEAIDCAYEIKSKIIAGPFHSAFATFSRKNIEEAEYDRSADILHAAGEYAAKADITLTPEALNRFEIYLCNTMQQLLKLIQKVDHPHVQGMFDTHHANMEEKKYESAIKTIAPVLKHVHISENDRGTPGDGHIPWDETFATLASIQYKGWLTIEAFSRNDEEFANAINVWREFSPPWEIAEKGYEFIQKMGNKHGL